MLDPPAQGQKKALERHHLFAKKHLNKIGFEGVRDTNQIANYALLEWDDNIGISDARPMCIGPNMQSDLRPLNWIRCATGTPFQTTGGKWLTQNSW